MKKDEDIKHWILLTISEAQEKRVNASEIYKNKPEFIVVDYRRFLEIIDVLERDEFLQKEITPLMPILKITPKGEKKVRNSINDVGLKVYYNLVRYFPKVEFKDRIENLEAFVFGTVLLTTSYLLITQKVTENVYLLYLFLIVLLISFVISGSYLSTIFYLVLERFQISFINWLTNLIDNNKRWIGYGVIIMFTVIGIVLIKNKLAFSDKEIIGAVVLEVIFLILKRIKDINKLIISLGKM